MCACVLAVRSCVLTVTGLLGGFAAVSVLAAKLPDPQVGSWLVGMCISSRGCVLGVTGLGLRGNDGAGGQAARPAGGCVHVCISSMGLCISSVVLGASRQ